MQIKGKNLYGQFIYDGEAGNENVHSHFYWEVLDNGSDFYEMNCLIKQRSNFRFCNIDLIL